MDIMIFGLVENSILGEITLRYIPGCGIGDG